MGFKLADINASLAHATKGKIGIADVVHRVDVAESIPTHLVPLCGSTEAKSFVYQGSNVRVTCAKCLRIEGGKPARKRTGREGRPLENLIIASIGIALTKIPMSIKYIGGGEKVAVSAPVDFFGTMNGRSVVFDAKEGGLPHRLLTDDDHLKKHQRAEIVHHGEHGAIAGLLAMSTTVNRLYWIDWRKLLVPRPSIQWSECVDIGPASKPVDWQKIEFAARINESWPDPANAIYPEPK